jgi:hypothetical protein
MFSSETQAMCGRSMPSGCFNVSAVWSVSAIADRSLFVAGGGIVVGLGWANWTHL